MKKNLLYLLLAGALFTSCSSAYRTSQTPDDVYYSPAKKIIPADQYDAYNSTSDNYNSSDDEYLRMKVQDHQRWSAIDDYDYWYDSRYYNNNYYSPYSSYISLGVGFGSYPYYTSYNPYWYNPWHSWYSPYYTVVYYKNPTVYYQSANRHNVAGYNNRNYNNYNMPLQNSNRSNAYNNSNYNANRTRNNNYQNQNNNIQPSRTFNNSSSNMNSGGGGGSRTSGGGTRTRP
jgi:hypothetical protein